MSYSDEFAQSEPAQRIAAKIRSALSRRWTIMEFSGTHTQTILEYGIDRLLPEAIEIIHGPGCAICITPLEIIDRAFAIARLPDVIFCLFGQLLRVPGSSSDLLEAKASGADVRVVYSATDCVKIAQDNPERKVVFFAVGSERALPENAAAVLECERLGLKNFYMLSAQANMPPICSAVLQRHGGNVHALLCPGTNLSVVGYKDYETISRNFKLPIVVAGIEPLDVMEGVYKCVLQLEGGKHTVENQCGKVVTRMGNTEEQELIQKVFTLMDFHWRRLGAIQNSGFHLKSQYDAYDAWSSFAVEDNPAREPSVCISEEIMLGLKKPWDCPAFGKSCTREHPVGGTMVSPEGTCTLYHKYKVQEQPEPLLDQLRQSERQENSTLRLFAQRWLD